MNRQPEIAAFTAISGLVILLFSGIAPADSLTVTNTFVPNTPATAASVNQNFADVEASVNDNDSRITTNRTDIDDHETRIQALEGLSGITPQSVSVDCNADPDAFINTTINDNTSYDLTGICNGPIIIFRKRNVVVEGASANKTLDGVQLPPGIVSNPFAAIGIYESIAEVRDITVDASNYVAGSGNPWGSGISSLAVAQNSSARIYNTDIKGGDYGLDVFRNSYARAYETVTITGFNENGISAYYNSNVEVLNDITVTGRAGTTVSYPTAIGSGYNSVVDIKSGGTLTSPTGGASQWLADGYNAPVVIGAYNAGIARVRSSITLVGGVEIGAGSLLRMDAGTMTGDINCYDSSHCRLQNISHSGGYVWVARNGSLRIGGSSSIDTTGTGFSSILGSNIGVRDSATITATSIQIRKNGTFYTGGSPDLNNSPILCDSLNDQVNLGGSPANVDLTGCP